MLIDARTVQNNETLRADVCIVGSGPAGLTLARELAGRSIKVIVLESGGLEYDADTQSLYEGETTGEPFQSLSEVRRRQFGGTANIWDSRLSNDQVGLRCAPLDEIDFEKKDWLPHTGWPFKKSDLDPFYERAQSVCQLGPYNYNFESWASREGPRLFESGLLDTGTWQFGNQYAFTRQYRDEIERAENVSAFLNANVVEIETGETASQVTRLHVASLEDSKFRVEARLFVLATGGIENARLLLLSDRVQKTGLGNQNDLVGRCFMEHPWIRCGTLFPSDRRLFDKAALYDARWLDGVLVMGRLTLAQAVIRREKLLNLSTVILPVHKRYKPEAVVSLKTLIASGLRAKMPPDFSGHLKNVAKGIDYIGVAASRKVTGRNLFPYIVDGPSLLWGGWSELEEKEKRFSAFKVFHVTEQAPDPDNRVTLMGERDRLGCRKVRLHWRWGDVNAQSVRRAQELMASEMARAGVGRLKLEYDGENPVLASSGLHHHMGTTRMHQDPKQGVVDENCKVHGISNLFIAGSSVFPTGGCINPTLTIIALAVRLADHLKAVIATYPQQAGDNNYRTVSTGVK